MTAPLRLRGMRPADIAFADAVRALAGWNQTRDDWTRFLALEPAGCFLAEWNGQPAGTATTTIYGDNLAWIGMVLVHPEYRRRGVGRALLTHCLEFLRARGVRCIKLDATPAGQPVYEGLGFRPEWTLTRWEHEAAPNGRDPSAPLRAWRPEDLAALAELDARAFGVPRTRLWEALVPRSQRLRVIERPAGEVAGCGLLRKGARASYLGPVIAAGPADGLALIDALLRGHSGGAVYWDIPDGNRPAKDLARDLGFAAQRSLTRMFLGENRTSGNPAMQFALAGPEVG